jgi:hypothetical protein
MPRYFFHLRLGSRIVARDGVGHACLDYTAALDLARLGTGLFVLDPFLPSLECSCFVQDTEVYCTNLARSPMLPYPHKRSSIQPRTRLP